jgi:hypothetical protein
VSSFLLSTPQTGVDSIAVTYALLGPVYAIYRPLAAFVTGMIGGSLIRLLGESVPQSSSAEVSQVTEMAGDDKTAADVTCNEACCDSDKGNASRLQRVLRYGFTTLPKDIGLALLIGVLVAGVLTALLPAASLGGYIGGGFLSLVIMMVAGVPLYVCATASVPIAAGLIYAGASPGAALAFLIAGPATNAATIAMIWRVMGKRTTALYLLTVIFAALAGGFLLDRIYDTLGMAMPAMVSEHAHDETGPGLLGHASGIVLLIVLLRSYNVMGKLRPGKRDKAETPTRTSGGDVELEISGMTCSHCADAVKRALQTCKGVVSAEVKLDSGKAFVQGDDIDRQCLKDAVSELGYAAQ